MLRYALFVLILILLSQSPSYSEDLTSPPNSDGTTKIYISLVINNISDVNAASQIMKADLYLVAKWNDPRLKHDGPPKVMKESDSAWAPLITISNRLNINKSFSDEITISNDGTATYFQRIYGDFTQNFRLHDFPFDTQTFEIKILEIGNDSKQLELVPDTTIKSGISDNLSLPEWKILDWKYDTASYSIIKGAPELNALTFIFHAKRQSGYYLLVFVIPLVLIIIMSWMAFWLDSKLSSSQISIATTSMLTLIAYRFVVSGSLPKISYMTRMDIFVLGSSVLIFVTLIQSVITASFYSRGKELLAENIDRKCRWIFPLLYLIVCLIAFVF